MTGAYRGSTFARGMPADAAFCKRCLALSSTHIGDELTCPVKAGGVYERGGTLVYWTIEEPNTPIFSDDGAAIGRLAMQAKVRKVLHRDGARLCYVTSQKQELDLTHEESQMVGKLLALRQSQQKPVDLVTEDPTLYDGLTPDEVGYLVEKLLLL